MSAATSESTFVLKSNVGELRVEANGFTGGLTLRAVPVGPNGPRQVRVETTGMSNADAKLHNPFGLSSTVQCLRPTP